MEEAIRCLNVSKKYKLYTSSKDRLLGLLSPSSYGEDFHALKNVDFIAKQGEVVGFVGINGSGKSTLSNIIAGIIPHTSGEVRTNGSVALIAVSAGLKNDLSGRDNIEMKLLMLGFTREEIKSLEQEIIDFSELESFIDQPVKNYSSGMKSRLGFAISVSVDPDILIIDEALSVGDKAFAEKSLNKMIEFKEQGKTMIFVSHSLGQMKRFCNKILWLEFGKVKKYGDVEDVIPEYERFLKVWQRMSEEERKEYRSLSLESKEVQSLEAKFLKKENNIQSEIRIVSKIGHFNSNKSQIVCDLERSKVFSSENYKHKAYFIKREVFLSGEKHYLLSTTRSGSYNTLGWVNEQDVTVLNHTVVELDQKKGVLNSEALVYKVPWGGGKQKLDVKIIEKNVKIVQTDLVGNNVWYKVCNENLTGWVHYSDIQIDV